jgi:hypothetical protein
VPTDKTDDYGKPVYEDVSGEVEYILTQKRHNVCQAQGHGRGRGQRSHDCSYHKSGVTVMLINDEGIF